MNEYIYSLAKRAAELTGEPIKAEWLYSQWMHETQYLTNWGATVANNFGGLKQFKPQPEWFDGDDISPEGDPYQVFDSPEAYADYFGGVYLPLYRVDGIYEAQTLDDYIRALHRGGYFTDELENYIAATNRIYQENFNKEETV